MGTRPARCRLHSVSRASLVAGALCSLLLFDTMCAFDQSSDRSDPYVPSYPAYDTPVSAEDEQKLEERLLREWKKRVADADVETGGKLQAVVQATLADPEAVINVPGTDLLVPADMQQSAFMEAWPTPSASDDQFVDRMRIAFMAFLLAQCTNHEQEIRTLRWFESSSD